MTFKFRGNPVSFADGVLHSDDEITMSVLSPLVKCAYGGPEDGDPILNLFTEIFGEESITDVIFDDEDPYLIH